MQISKSENRSTEIISNKIRSLAGATGCLTAVTVTVAWASPVFAIFPICLILGAALAGRFPRRGRDLIWFGAGLLSLTGLPIGVYLLYFTKRGSDPRVTVAAAASVLLVVWCDVAVVMEAIKMRRTRIAGKSRGSDRLSNSKS